MAQARAGIFGPFHDQNGRKLQFPPLGFKPAPVATSSATPGLLGDLTDLRRQQAQFQNTLNDLDRRNRWLAIPALAPAAAVVGLEAAEGLLGPSRIDQLATAHPRHDIFMQSCREVLGLEITTKAAPNGKIAGFYLDEDNFVTLDQMGDGVAEMVRSGAQRRGRPRRRGDKPHYFRGDRLRVRDDERP